METSLIRTYPLMFAMAVLALGAAGVRRLVGRSAEQGWVEVGVLLTVWALGIVLYVGVHRLRARRQLAAVRNCVPTPNLGAETGASCPGCGWRYQVGARPEADWSKHADSALGGNAFEAGLAPAIGPVALLSAVLVPLMFLAAV